MALPDFTAIIDLKIVVDVGLVDGTIPITSPTGPATSIVCFTGSSSMIPTVFISFISSYSKVEAA